VVGGSLSVSANSHSQEHLLTTNYDCGNLILRILQGVESVKVSFVMLSVCSHSAKKIWSNNSCMSWWHELSFQSVR